MVKAQHGRQFNRRFAKKPDRRDNTRPGAAAVAVGSVSRENSKAGHSHLISRSNR
ncbi:Hypothetical protein I596_1179 [Dokdonella koreensis DS-123]|uniref:Uncharacterized protein n=1 Tax=Dokdonella koreensis DS-123 TaxID=1300342 RepID=A0A160DSF3_9GAMM|nr:Hypothetical protein I596_1179 [Dokdonella koreensis DS-123]